MEVHDVAKKAVNMAIHAGASAAEATVEVTDGTLTRFTKNAIHQNVGQVKNQVSLDVVFGKNRRGTATFSSFDEAALRKGVDLALKIAKLSSPDTGFTGFPSGKYIKSLEGCFIPETDRIDPEFLAEGVMSLINTALNVSKKVKWSTGALSKYAVSLAVANSEGVEAEFRRTIAGVDIVCKAGEDESGSGYAKRVSRDVRDFDFEALAQKSAMDAVNSINPKLIDIGEYEAIFTPSCLSSIFTYMSMNGFSAKSHQDGFGCLVDKIGHKVFDERITIIDDGRDVSTLNAAPFDGEGTPKSRVSLVNNGVLENICHDHTTATKADMESTGHALPKTRGSWYRGMPMPDNMVMDTGDATYSEMIEETRKGVFISRLHYVNSVRSDLGILSGLTRDACWLIEDGEIVHPIKVMRFTDGMLDILSNVDILGSSETMVSTGSAIYPAMKVGSFKFTGQSQF